MKHSTTAGLSRHLLQKIGCWQFIALLASLLLVITYFFCRSWALAYFSGTWTYLGYVERLLTQGYPPGHIWYTGLPTDWPAFSVWYLFLAGLTRLTSLPSADIWVLLPILLIPLGVFCQFLWIKSLTQSNVAALLGTIASFWFPDVWMLVAGPSTRFVAFYLLAPLALFFLYRAFVQPRTWWSWAMLGGLSFGLMIQVHTLFALQLSMLLCLFAVFLCYFRSSSFVAEIKALSVFAVVGLLVGAYRLLTLLFDPGRALSVNSFYADTQVWNTSIGAIPLLDPARYLGLFSPFYFGIAFLLLGLGWLVLLRQWRTRRYLVAWISSLVFLCGLIYLTPLGALLGRFLTPAVVSEIFLTSNLPPFGLALGVAVIELAGLIIQVKRRVVTRFGFPALAKYFNPTSCLLVALVLFIIASVAPIQFYLGKMGTAAVTGDDFLGASAKRYLEQETGADTIVLADPRTSHVLPALVHRQVMIADRLFMARNYDQRLLDASKAVNPGTPTNESLQILKRYKVGLILLNPRFWNSARNRENEKQKYGFDFPDNMSAVVEKFSADSRFALKTFDDGTVIFRVPAD